MPTKRRERPVIPERLLAQLWRSRAWRQTRRTTDGRRLRVLYPGRPNGGPGPDFKDAVVQMEGAPPVQGDVELHRQSSGWRQHGHQRDTRYNGVVLHVVLGAPEKAAASSREDGETVPVAAMNAGPMLPGIAGNASEGLIAQRLEQLQRMPPEKLGSLLDKAGRERFLAKSGMLQRAMKEEPADEVLYRGIMEALGYSKNRDPFLELARRLPWGLLMDMVRDVPAEGREERIHAALLSAAGLSPQTASAIQEQPHPMDASAWCTAGVRPANHPRRRIKGAALLLARYVDTSLLEGMASSTRDDGMTGLLRSLATTEERGALIGRSRALDIAVNVVLPGLHAWRTLQHDRALAALCLRLYTESPSIADNEVTREAAVLLGLAEGWTRWGALRQQGMMCLYRTLLNDF